jgi:undecaprenyl phosphate N,N'-diacetylbacillosamine 1-phosphate transferase
LIYRDFIKPISDRVFALSILTIFSPVLLVTAVTIRIKMGSPVLFRQLRPTKDEKIFKIYKFRTMTDDRDSNGELLPDSERLKGFGKFVRSTSLDELPQIINVLKGDISFIGPRPLLPEYLPLYSDFQKQRHSVKAGITGLAQIKGRNNISWRNKFRYDVFYAKRVSFRLDLYIALMTVWKILKRSDVSQDGKATAEKFRGE